MPFWLIRSTWPGRSIGSSGSIAPWFGSRLLAADSRQFARGIELARGIENGESRAEAMLILAEAQCRPGIDQHASATVAYQAAAEAVATIHQDGLRGVLTGFLVDSLISTGRFDDARACVVIYPLLSEKLVALGAIAEQQGRRGSAEAGAAMDRHRSSGAISGRSVSPRYFRRALDD